MKCWNCGETGHVQYLPFQQTSVKLDLAGPGGRSRAKEFRPQMVLSVRGRGGLVAVGEITGHPLKFLIDTGAVVTSLKGDVSQISGRRHSSTNHIFHLWCWLKWHGCFGRRKCEDYHQALEGCPCDGSRTSGWCHIGYRFLVKARV